MSNKDKSYRLYVRFAENTGKKKREYFSNA